MTARKLAALDTVPSKFFLLPIIGQTSYLTYKTTAVTALLLSEVVGAGIYG